MRNRNLSVLILSALFLLAMGDLAWHYGLLPERVASHFDNAGVPNGWMPKGAFVITTLFVMSFTAVLQSVLAGYLTRLPNEAINLPNKEYWLAPERRQETLAVFADHQMQLAAATQALLTIVFHLVYQANLSPQPQLSNTTWLYLVLFGAFMVWWVTSLIGRFRRQS